MTQVRYILRRNGQVLTKPEYAGGVLRWLPEEEAGEAIVTYVTNKAALTSAAMIAHDAEVVQQVNVLDDVPIQHCGEVGDE